MRSYEEITVYFEQDGKRYIVARIATRQGFNWVFNLDCGACSFQDDNGDGYSCDERATVGTLIKHLKWHRRQLTDCHPDQIRKWQSKEIEYLDKKVMPILKVFVKSFNVDV